MKVLIPVIMYRRHKTFNVFAQGIRNLQEAFPDVDIECIIIGTGDEKAAERHGFEYYEYKNEPLSEKAQYRLSLCKDRADYYLFMGSDDVMDVKLFAYYLDKMRKGYGLIACYDIHYYHKGIMYYSKGYRSNSIRYGEGLAVGRCVSNGVLRKHDWQLWMTKKSKGLDGLVWKKLKNTKKRHIFYSQHIGLLMDIKTNRNLSKLNENRHIKVGMPSDYVEPNIMELLNVL